MLETTGELPGADRPMQQRELHNGDRAEALDGVWDSEQPADKDSALRTPRRPRCRRDSSIRLVTRWHAACALVFTEFNQFG